nr:f-box protein cpr30 [Quercus suber]
MKSQLPPEIINEILSRLPVKSLLRFLCVSMQWYARIKNQVFIKLHRQRSIEDNRDRTLILEQIARVCHVISSPSISSLRITSTTPSHFIRHCTVQSAFLLLILPPRNSGSLKHRFNKNLSWRFFLEVLKGQLCFIVSTDFETETGHDYNDVWLMKEYGEESSWTWIYKIERRSVPWNFKYCKPLMFSKNDKKVLLEMRQYNRRRQYNCTKLVWYDIEKKKGVRVKIQNLPDSFETAICVGSLLLLDGDDVIDPAEQNNKRKRDSFSNTLVFVFAKNESPSEVPNPNLFRESSR